MSTIDDRQGVLPLRRVTRLDEAIVGRPRDLLRAFVMAADLGGLEDKQAASGAGMDPSTWSRFKQGDVGIKPANLETFLNACGNDLPLAFWARARGYELTPLESELEHRLRLERERGDKLEEQVRLLKSLWVGRAE